MLNLFSSDLSRLLELRYTVLNLLINKSITTRSIFCTLNNITLFVLWQGWFEALTKISHNLLQKLLIKYHPIYFHPVKISKTYEAQYILLRLCGWRLQDVAYIPMYYAWSIKETYIISRKSQINIFSILLVTIADHEVIVKRIHVSKKFSVDAIFPFISRLYDWRWILDRE